MKRIIKKYYKKYKQYFNIDPKVEKVNNISKYIPNNYKSVLIFCIDFELAWAWQFCRNINHLEKARLERKNFEKVLNSLNVYELPVTWATVGHLFLENCSCENGYPHKNIKRIKHFKNDYWNFIENDWFINDPCSNYIKSPEWYAPDLVRKILNTKVKHEIACHTFSHVNCDENVCDEKVFTDEILECKRLAEKYNLTLKSFIYPGNVIGHIKLLPLLGFTSYRTDFYNTLGYPIYRNGLWEIKSTMEINNKYGWSFKEQLNYYLQIINKSIKTNTVCYLWCHLLFDDKYFENVFINILKSIYNFKNDIYITTTSNYIDFLNYHNDIL